MAYFGRLPYSYKSPFNYALDQGTQTVPSLAFIGDTNNGIFSPATDNLAITTDGVERLRVTSIGNVGIGTTVSTFKLHILDTASSGAGLLVQGGGQGEPIAKFERTVGGAGSILISSSGSLPQLRFFSGNTDYGAIGYNTINTGFEISPNGAIGSNPQFFVKNTGNIGIGTTNPLSKLDVRGPIFIQGGVFAGNLTYGGRSIETNIDISSTSLRSGVTVRNNNDYRVLSNNASFMHLDAYNTTNTSYAFRAASGSTLTDTFWVKGNGEGYFSKFITIGKTANNTATLGVELYSDGVGGLVTATRNNNVCFIANRTSGNGAVFSVRRDNTSIADITASTTAVSYNTSSTSGIIGADASTIRIRVDSNDILTARGDSGRMGIGTTSPRQLLEVNGNTSFGIPENSWTSVGIRPNTTGLSGILYSHGAFRASWSCNGYRNNTTPTNQWTSAGINGQSGAAMIEMDPTGFISFHTDASKATGSLPTITNRVRIDSAGNVGIGTTIPSVALDVNSNTIRIRTARTPASATATGAAGEISWDADYIYVCTATNTWRRAALSSW